jgi:DNA-binding transcriptional ArsR family regulator
MKAGPDIALVASLVGDPARANILTALLDGQALTATELAGEACVTSPTASSHLAKLEDGGLIAVRKQGRHRYYSLSGEDVAAALEALMGVAARAGHLRTRSGPKEPALRLARVCYDHLAGDYGVHLFESLAHRGVIEVTAGEVSLAPPARRFSAQLGIDLEALGSLRRPMCKACLDWSVRRNHLAGALGAAILQRFYDLKWAKRVEGSRAVEFSRRGDQEFARLFGKPATQSSR